MRAWALFAAFLIAILIQRRLRPDPLVEVDRKARWTIEGPFGPGEMPIDLQRQWDDLKRTGIGPNHSDF